MASPNTSPTGGVGWRNLRTGILFTFGIGVAAALGLFIGKNTGLLTTHDTINLFITDIKGLGEGNMVTISGKKVGVVESMFFTTRNDTMGVQVMLDVQTEFIPLIPEDSRAVIKSLGVLGDRFIDIARGRSPEHVVDGAFIEVISQPGFDELTESAITTMGSIEDFSARVNRGEGTLGKLMSSTELNDRLVRSVTNLEAVTEKLASGKGLAGRLIGDEDLANRLEMLVDNLGEVSASLKQGRGSLGKLIVDDTFYNNLVATTQKSDSLLARLNHPDGSFARLTGDSAIYFNLNHSIMSLDSLLMDLKANPGRYVRVSVF